MRGAGNRLARESSPYLLQHAHNPVDWFAWGPEAIAEARRRDVPIFLSIGYSTCYWCHVMERESFEDSATAEVMNARFVNVKLDREERPDLDEVYMAAVQTLTGRGGWPMSVFLEPGELKPFWAGTYFPPRPAQGMPSFGQVLRGMSEAYAGQREQVLKQAEEVASAVRENLARPAGAVRLGIEQVAMATQTLLTIVDRAHGGFGGAPKFPQPVYLELLLDVRGGADGPTREAIDTALRLTLDQMAIGGMNDQLAGGFHRYSVDRTWTVPHFEKMLYDNGQLLSVFARAAVALEDGYYARVARATAEWMLREMRVPGGAFATAQDAEVDGREGLNYVWRAEEVRAGLSAEDAEFACRVFGLDGGANFQDPHHADGPASNVLRLGDRPERVAAVLSMGVDEFSARLERVSGAMLKVRAARKQPRLDDKVITSWNGLAIAGLAQAGRLLSEPGYVRAAQAAADWLLAHHRAAGGRLLRISRGLPARVPAMLEDVAMLTQGLLELARAGGADRARNLAAADELMAEAEARFGDGDGGYFDTAADASELFIRPRATYDGAMPSGVSVMINNLVDRAELTGDGASAERAAAALRGISALVVDSPIARCNSTRGLLRLMRLDRGLVERVFAGLPGVQATANGAARAGGPVEVYSSEEQVLLAEGEPAALELRLVIAAGHHINASVPGVAGLVGLRVGIVGGSGVAAYADYPEGELLEGVGGERPRVHEGELVLPVVLERVGEWAGRPRLAVTVQACTDRACLEAQTLVLEVELRPVRR